MCKLSIITICYNIKDEIERTCKSIVNQTWQDFEWIVVDGGSTDGTVDVLKKYKDRINILISEPDNGIYNAMNKGIKLAKGEWLNFMNGGDCFCDNQVLEKVFSQHTKNDILYGQCKYHKSNNQEVLLSYPTLLNKSYFYSGCINHQSSFIKRNCFCKYGLYNERFKAGGDFEKWLCFLDKGCSFEAINFPVANFYEGGISSIGKYHYERELIVEKYYTVKKSFFILGFIPFIQLTYQKKE